VVFGDIIMALALGTIGIMKLSRRLWLDMVLLLVVIQEIGAVPMVN
jgi:hypothetical protein